MPKSALKTLRYLAEAAPLYAIHQLFRILPIGTASAIGGYSLRALGQWFPLSTTAAHNLHRALPELSSTERQEIIGYVWENLGRVTAEHVHLQKLTIGEHQEADIQVVGADIFRRLAENQQQVIFLSGHFGNWEALSLVAQYYHLPFVGSYRPANNPYVDMLLSRSRQFGEFAPKGKDGTKQLLAALKAKKNLAFLIDQKFNDGIETHFFGEAVMAADAPLTLARRYKLPVVLAWCRRIAPCRFMVIAEEPFMVENTTTNAEIMRTIHTRFETWIRHDPKQWLWLHKRWKKR